MKNKKNGAAVAPEGRQQRDSDALKSAMAELSGLPTPQSTVADVRAYMNPYGGAFVNLAFSIYGRNGHPALPLADLRGGIVAARDFLNRCAARFPAECGRATAGMALRIDDYLNGCGSSVWMTACELIKAAKQLHIDLAGVSAGGGGEVLGAIRKGVEFLVDKKNERSIKGREAQKKATPDPDIEEEQKRAAQDMRCALGKVRADPDVKAGKHGAILKACRRLCDWEDKTGHVHKGRFRMLPGARKYGEPQYEPLTDWSRHPIQPETLARHFREERGSKAMRKKP